VGPSSFLVVLRDTSENQACNTEDCAPHPCN
jgi:hypothetical protein